MTRREINDPREWRISLSGYSIKTGWGDDTRIVTSYHNGLERPFDPERYQQWLDDAQEICDAHNAALAKDAP